jgi:hypothetical protein
MKTLPNVAFQSKQSAPENDVKILPKTKQYWFPYAAKGCVPQVQYVG